MYKMVVESPAFLEKSKVEQHQLVTGVLKDILKGVHGFNLKTISPKVKVEAPPKEEKPT